MKHLIFITGSALSLVLLGAGCNSSQGVTAQQQKEASIIEVQKQKEIDVLNREHELRLEEKQAKQRAIDSCLNEAKEEARRRINLSIRSAYQVFELQYPGEAVGYDTLYQGLEKYCATKGKMRIDLETMCLQIINESLNDDAKKYELDQERCYARYK